MKPRKLSYPVKLNVDADGQPVCPDCQQPLVKVGQEDDAQVYACPDYAPLYAKLMRELGQCLSIGGST